MLVGYAQDIITPSLDRPVYLAGFGQNRRAESVHDDLYMRALALRSSQGTLVLCGLDLIGFFRQDVQEVIRRVRAQVAGLNRPEVLIAALHPHHGPDTMGLWGSDDRTSGVDPVYLAGLKDTITATILSALAAATKESPAMKAVSLHVPGLAKNARDPEIVDDELTVLQFLDPEGRPLVTLFNFPCHPEVLWEHNPHISADYPGVLRREVEQDTHAPCLFFSGALGGMMTPDVRDHSFEEAEAMGQALAQAGLKALEAAPAQTYSGVSLQSKELRLRLTNLLFKLAFRRKLLPDGRDRQGCITSEVNLIRIGPAWFAAVPGELLPKLGLALKRELKSAGAEVAGIISLANDELGYILPKEDFRYPLNPFNPGKHYEETMSISKEMGPAVVEAVRSLL
jgi:hypothetical protein